MIVLKNPENGEKIDLLTCEQLEFLMMDRSALQVENVLNIDYLNFKKENNDDYSFPKSIRLEWEADSEGIVQISEYENFDSFYSEQGKGFCILDNLKCGTRYFWRVVCGDEISNTYYFDTEDKCPRFVKIDGLTNVRDCGGWKTISGKKIRQGLLYRGCEMNSHINITEVGIKTMRETLKIKSVLDLRGKNEVGEVVCIGNYANIPALAYDDWLEQPDVCRKIFEFLLDEENYPLYFHCWAGADRTGTVAFLVGAVLGMSYQDLIDDYEITSLSMAVRTRNGENFKRFLEIFDSFKGESVSEKAKNYLLSCGTSESSIEKFRKLMLY